jgi:phosphoglycolate phosphatase
MSEIPAAAGDAWQTRLRTARGVLFDFDGTLAPNLDLPDLRRRVIAFTLKHEVPEPVFAGRYIVEILDAAAAWLAERDRAAAAAFHRRGHTLIRDFEVDAARDTGPFDDAVLLLERLRHAGKRVAVVTRNCRDAVLTVFPDVERHCDGVLTRDDVEHLKPDVRHLERALDGIGVTAPRTVMVGDGQMDMEIGRALGMYCVGVLTGSSDRQRLTEAGADVVLPRAGALLEALQEA